MDIETPDSSVADALADRWVALAREQHAHGSDLRAAENRAAIRETIVRSIVTGGVLVARTDESPDSGADSTPRGGSRESHAKRDGIVGFVTFGPETGDFAREADRGVIRNLYVDPGYRNAGIGSALLEAAEDALVADGVEVLAIEAMATNHAARRLYRRHGYTARRVELAKSVESDTH